VSLLFVNSLCEIVRNNLKEGKTLNT